MINDKDEIKSLISTILYVKSMGIYNRKGALFFDCLDSVDHRTATALYNSAADCYYLDDCLNMALRKTIQKDFIEQVKEALK